MTPKNPNTEIIDDLIEKIKNFNIDDVDDEDDEDFFDFDDDDYPEDK